MTEFMNSMVSAGIEPPCQIIADGLLHRFSVGEEKQKNGWYVLHADPLAGAFGHWKTGLNVKFSAAQSMSESEKHEFRKSVELAKSKRMAEEEKKQQLCREKAEAIWNKSKQGRCLFENGYITRKGIKPYRAKIYGKSLVLPVMDDTGTLHGLQFIEEDGNKMFLSGTAKHGCYLSMGKITDILCICEGYATGASIHESTGLAVAVSFDAGNMIPVAKVLKNKFPNVKIIMCADNDVVGIEKATTAARKVDGIVIYPPEEGQDFNDYHVSTGSLAINNMLLNAADTI